MEQQFINLDSVMEAETISKNGASTKSHTSSGHTMQKLFLFLTIFCVSVASIFAQDVITLKNGDEIQASVQEIGDVDVKYKRVDNPNGPNYTLKKSDIFMIKYANGSRDVFADDAAPATPTTPVPNTTTTPSTVTRQPSDQYQADALNEPLSINGIKIYNSNGVRLSDYEVQNAMRNVPEAFALYNSGKSLRTTGTVFFGVQLACLGVGIVQLARGLAEEDEDILMSAVYWSSGSLAAGVPAIIFLSISNKKIQNSVGVYNRSINQRNTSAVSLNFGIMQSGGIGFTLNF